MKEVHNKKGHYEKECPVKEEKKTLNGYVRKDGGGGANIPIEDMLFFTTSAMEKLSGKARNIISAIFVCLNKKYFFPFNSLCFKPN